MLFLSGNSFLYTSSLFMFMYIVFSSRTDYVIFVIFDSVGINGWEMMIAFGFLAAARYNFCAVESPLGFKQTHPTPIDVTFY